MSRFTPHAQTKKKVALNTAKDLARVFLRRKEDEELSSYEVCSMMGSAYP